MKIKTLLIDNNYESLVRLRKNVERYCPILEVIGETHFPKNSIELIDFLKPQLIFVDTALKYTDQFRTLAEMENVSFEIIYISAFDQNDVDYLGGSQVNRLLKPINNESLNVSVNVALGRIEKKKVDMDIIRGGRGSGFSELKRNRIAIPTQDGIEFIKVNEIVHCQGVDGYTKLFFMSNKMLLSSRSIGHFTRLLKDFGFYLVHKSHLINQDHICKYLNEGYIELVNNDRVPVSRNRRIGFLNSFKSLVP